jgi:uncharacterized protein YjlB
MIPSETHITDIETYLIEPNGNFPNNEALPLVIYKLALKNKSADEMIELFKRNNWSNSWKNSIYDYHHYHSKTHEVLGVYEGKAIVQFGGPNGVVANVKSGDVIIIPAGVAHKNVSSDEYFACVGAYPDGKEYDMDYGKEEELEKAIKNIQTLPLPSADPVYGKGGVLFQYWREKETATS